MFVDILVGLVRQQHDFSHRTGKLSLIISRGNACTGACEFFEQIRFLQRAGKLSIKALGNKPGTTAGDVYHLANQIGIHTESEILKIQIDIIYTAAKLCSKVISQILRIKIAEVSSCSNKCTARFGHFLSINCQEAM